MWRQSKQYGKGDEQNKSARIIKDLKIINDAGANIYDMMRYKNVLLTQSSVKNLEKRILNEKN